MKTKIIKNYVSIFHSKKMSMMGINLIWDNIILFAARGVMMHFQSGPQDHLGWPPLASSDKRLASSNGRVSRWKSEGLDPSN